MRQFPVEERLSSAQTRGARIGALAWLNAREKQG